MQKITNLKQTYDMFLKEENEKACLMLSGSAFHEKGALT